MPMHIASYFIVSGSDTRFNFTRTRPMCLHRIAVSAHKLFTLSLTIRKKQQKKRKKKKKKRN